MYEWCVDNGFTPHLVVAVDRNTRVPPGYVKNGEIVLNVNYSATKDLLIGNDAVTFAARFGGASFDIYVPIDAVRGIFARENGQGMFFEPESVADEPIDQGVETPPESSPPPPRGKPELKVVK
jgi:stringent starvation protein B